MTNEEFQKSVSDNQQLILDNIKGFENRLNTIDKYIKSISERVTNIEYDIRNICTNIDRIDINIKVLSRELGFTYNRKNKSVQPFEDKVG